ncbi:arylsulfatase A-like enzyme [Algoriphagus boseongensis]|uniref:Arylsulfatase A-like enzyme n=1 Tax=Algoriphagus boseongensis TaxID=1442587 RepID=A0A4R6T2Y2_9BACT|nr:arylsulfatase [Algoriphagus boseongensis]TDQ15118.1 arylsulfatase A-like enzyme [Algoriphagus boseongensis]
MKHCLVIFLALVLFSFQGKNQSEAPLKSPPNVIFILADDLGYGDLGFLGQQYIETPNIDRLAAEGMVFTNHYSGATVCAPSRSAFMTGLHTGHTPIRGNSEVQPEGQYPMPDTLMTISKVFQKAGYVTGAFGKWGLGMNETTGDPLNQGFGEFYGYLCQRYAHRYYPAYLWQNGVQVNLPGNDWTNKVTYAPDLIQKESLAFIEKNKDMPFFLFMPIVTPHAELAAPDDGLFQKYRNKFGEEKPHLAPPGGDYGPEMKIPGYQSEPYPHAAFAAMVERIDRYVGEVVSKLEELGLSENTLIVFTSDNGAHREGGADPDFFDSNGPFRGYKRDLYEGGIHVPLVVKWPGKIKANSSSDHVSAFWDWLPTFAELLGEKSPDGIDGISLVPTLLGKGNQAEHETLYWEFHELGGRQALRKGDWKLVKYQVKDSSKTSVELFDLKNDPGELTDLAAQNPQIVEELEVLLEKSRWSNPVFNLFEN